MRNLTLIKCALGRRASWTTRVPVAGYGMSPVVGLGHRGVIAERKQRFANDLPAARIKNQTTDLPIDASAPLPERRP